LTRLNLGNNQLTALPPEIAQLQHLTLLDLWDNQLTALPPEIAQLQHLTLLDLRNNQLTALPPEIQELDDLRGLGLEENAMEAPPLEALDPETEYSPHYIQGAVDITKLRNWFRQAAGEGVDYLYEAKLLIVGEGGAGKTSLLRRLVNPDAELPEPDDSTRGIDIQRWEFDCEPRHQPADAAKPQTVPFRVNFWDFGGQQIYHATHQFFLTKRSLYALVADTRKEDTNFYDWLNMVELFGQKSPVFIVKNQKDERPVELDEPSLRERFGNLKEVFDCNLLTNHGRQEVVDFVRYQIQRLPHVGQALPKTWLQVRRALESDPRDYVTLEEYLTICDAHGFKRRQDALDLSDYLHDLGVCLHFRDDELLERIVILKPTWGTDAVYRVLDSKPVNEAQGRFTRDDLRRIWSEERYADRRPELLRLMTEFKLCYELPEPGHYIAPQLLGRERPAYAWDETENLQLRYAYPRFMPRGILTRFIVELHDRIEAGRERVWQHGVVLADDATRAEVREDPERREIRIRVSGAHKRDLLSHLVYRLEEIHAPFRKAGLEYERKIPCNCERCGTHREPSFYDYSELTHFRDEGWSTIQCRKSGQQVDVRGLLDDVIDERAAQPRGYGRNRTEPYDEHPEGEKHLHLHLPSPPPPSAHTEPPPAEPWYKAWWVVSSTAGAVVAVVIGLLSANAVWGAGAGAAAALLALFLNPRRRFFRVGVGVLGMTGLVNLIPALNLHFAHWTNTENGANGLVVQGISENRGEISGVLILLAGVLFVLDHLQDRRS
ncbi:COR domain-containing protein, partial [Endothiovibrio diazotrophicus]